MICIYHSRDLDGFASGAIVKRKYTDATLIGYDYGQPFPWDRISKDEEVVMIDVSLNMPDMLKLSELCHKLTWIDHHISAINDYHEFLRGLELPLHFLVPVLEDGISACEGGWKYLFPDEEMPIGIRLLGEYDTWRNKDRHHWENRVLPYQFGMRMYCTSPEKLPWKSVTSQDGVNDVVEAGVTVLLYQAQVNEGQCKKAFPYHFKGLSAICLNGGGFNSDVFKSVYDPEQHDIMMPFQFNGKFWTFSLYTTKDDIDCSAIAKSMGGGGHRKASGFQVNHLSEVFHFMDSQVELQSAN